MDIAALLDTLRTLGSASNKELLRILTDFNHQNQGWFGTPVPQRLDHRELVDKIFTLIREISKSSESSSCDREEVAEAELLKELYRCLKILSRSKEYGLVISKASDYFTTLLVYGNIIDCKRLESHPGLDVLNKNCADQKISALIKETEIEVLKIICNSVFHSNDSRSVYKKNCCSKYVTSRLGKFAMAEHYENAISSVLVKILFIMSALDTEDRDNMRFFYNTSHVLLQLLERNVAQICKSMAKSENDCQRGLFDVYCEEIREILKTLFNISVKVCDESMLEDSECKNYCLLVEILHKFLTEPSLKDQLYNGLITDIANLLINIPQCCLDNLIPGVKRRKWEDPVPTEFGYPLEYELRSMSAIVTLLHFLNEDLQRGYGIQGDTSQAFSILVALCHICRCLCMVRKYLRKQILPPLRGAPVRPEESKTLKGRIIKLMTHPEINIKTIAADFLFVLCKEDPDRLVKHTGYGNAAGLFAARGLLGGAKQKVSSDYSSDDDDSETDEYAAIADKVDPITGVIASKQGGNPCENMTDEEREASANELMKLIDQMSSLDVIKPATIGEDGRPQQIDANKAKQLIQKELEKDKK